MRRWADQVNAQRKSYKEQARASSKTTIVPDNEFYSLRDQQLENPHKMYAEDDEEDDLDGTTISSQYGGYGGYSITRNDSQNTFRSRSTTGESGPPMNRVPPRQFPMGAQTPMLSLRTGGPMSPEPNDSFFSPTTESPISTRSSGMSSMFGYPRGMPPPMPGAWDDHRFTAPALPRQQVISYQPNPRMQAQRPSLPPSAHSASGATIQSRLRSASSPDIANPMRRYDPTQVPPMPDLPPFPAGYAYPPGVLNRSQSSSPAQAMSNLPMRSATQSPPTQQARLPQALPRSIPSSLQVGQNEFGTAQALAPRQMSYATPDTLPAGQMNTGLPRALQLSAPVMGSMPAEQPLPSQLKVKVHCPSAGSSMTFVVPANISFQSLKDRIDVKLQRSTSLSLSSGQVKLKYLDDDDYVSIQSDEDVQMAFETWRESQRAQNLSGIGEIDLYIQ
jgi:cell division control protein 24